MPQIIQLTETDLHRMITEAVQKMLDEDGAMGGDAATPGATSASADRVGAFDVPFGAMQRRDIYAPKKKKGKMSTVDMGPALRRHDGKGGSISIPKD